MRGFFAHAACRALRTLLPLESIQVRIQWNMACSQLEYFTCISSGKFWVVNQLYKASGRYGGVYVFELSVAGRCDPVPLPSDFPHYTLVLLCCRFAALERLPEYLGKFRHVRGCSLSLASSSARDTYMACGPSEC